MEMEVEIYNPKNRPVDELPTIYGFNNGGRNGWYHAQLIAEDGTPLGGHICSHEGYMPGDLGVLKGTRKDRHEGFMKHYPDGYKMEFVGHDDAPTHEGLQKAFENNDKLRPVQPPEANDPCVEIEIENDDGQRHTVSL